MPTTTPTDTTATRARAHPHGPWPGASLRTVTTRTTRTITSTLTLGSRLLESDVMRSRSAMTYLSADSGLSMTCRSGDIPEHWPRRGCLCHASSKTTASLLAPDARVRGHGYRRWAHSCPSRRCRHVARTPPCQARDRAERPENFRFCARASACRLALRRVGRRARDPWAVSSRTGSQHLVLDTAVRCAVLPALPAQTAEGRRLPRVRRSSLLHTPSDGDLPSRQEHGGLERDD
jgi:hypothetical protein